MTVNASSVATPTSASLGMTLNPAPPLTLPGPIRRAAEAGGDLLALWAIALSIPFVILAVGIPIALVLRLLVWLAGML